MKNIFFMVAKKISELQNFQNFCLHDEKIFFIPIFFYDLDYVSRAPENYTEHHRVPSGRDTGRVRSVFPCFFVIFHDFWWFSSVLGAPSAPPDSNLPHFSKMSPTLGELISKKEKVFRKIIIFGKALILVVYEKNCPGSNGNT